MAEYDVGSVEVLRWSSSRLWMGRRLSGVQFCDTDGAINDVFLYQLKIIRMTFVHSLKSRLD